MSAIYHFIKDKNGKTPYFNLNPRLEYSIWLEVLEEYPVTWDIETRFGQFLMKNKEKYNSKRIAYFDFIEVDDDITYKVDSQVHKTGKYTFYITYDETRGLSTAQFYSYEKKKVIPLLFEISQKLSCYLIRDTKKLITQEYIDSL